MRKSDHAVQDFDIFIIAVITAIIAAISSLIINRYNKDKNKKKVIANCGCIKMIVIIAMDLLEKNKYNINLNY